MWVLVLAAQACDWVEGILRWAPLGLPAELYSHAYPFVVVAAAVAAAAVWLWKRSSGAALTILIIYLSHPAADYITGFKPLWNGGDYMGLRMVVRPAADFFIQGMLCLVAVVLYRRSLLPERRGRATAVVLLLPLLALQALFDATHARAARRARSPKTTVTSARDVRNEVIQPSSR